MDTTRIAPFVIMLGVAMAAWPGGAEAFGRFEGTVQTEWLDHEDDHRRMRLLSDFSYIDARGIVWHAPKGWVVDGASIPRAAWTLAGSPYSGPYRRASVIHDVACDERTRPWQDVHLAFYNAMRAEGVGPVQAGGLYIAVLVGGPRWEMRASPVIRFEDADSTMQALIAALPEDARVEEVRMTTALARPTADDATWPAPPELDAAWAGVEIVVVAEAVPPRALAQDELERIRAFTNSEAELTPEAMQRFALTLGD